MRYTGRTGSRTCSWAGVNLPEDVEITVMVKRFSLFAATLFFCSASYGATSGGACPTGSNYVNVANEGQAGTQQVTLASLGVKSCYYVGVSGKDSNTGTSESAPFLHLPGSSNFTGSATIGPGVGVIIEGGYVAHFGNTSLSTSTGGGLKTNGGSSGSPVYYGIDPTWYSGSSFARPQFNGDNAIPNGTFPSSCSYDNSSLGQAVRPGGSYIIFDGIEIVGFCWSANNMNTFYTENSQTGIYLERLYQHGWSTPSTSSDSYYLWWDGGSGVNDGDILALSVVDGTDSSWASVGGSGTNCHWTSVSPTGPCYSGGAIYEGVAIVWGNVFQHMSNAAVTTNNIKWHDNWVNELAVSYQNNGQHTNCNNEVANVTGSNNYFYNNLTTNVRATECYFLSVSSGDAIYGFNNVFWGNMNYYANSAPSNCVPLNSISSSGTETLYWYNNTMDYAGGNGGGCQLQFGNANSPLYAWNGPGNFANNHDIGYTSLSGLYMIGTSGAQATITDNGGEVYETESLANTQNYTTTNNYAPTSTSGASYHAGVNESSFCSSISDANASAACASGIAGVALASGWGGEIASFPAVTPKQRGSSWDAGAYQYTLSPAAPPSLTGTVQPQ